MLACAPLGHICTCYTIPLSILLLPNKFHNYFQIIDANESSELNALINDESVINLLTQCGETSLLNVSFKNMYTSGCYY